MSRRLARALRRWNPDLHPRWPAGDERGGEFRPSGVADALEVIDRVKTMEQQEQPPLWEILDRDDDFHPAHFPDPEAGDVLDVKKVATEAMDWWSMPPTNRWMDESTKEIRHNVARWMRAVERVVGDALGRERSAWQGNVLLDKDLGFADGVKGWGCEFRFMSSVIAGWRTEESKPWGLMVHEMMHAYSQAASRKLGKTEDEMRADFIADRLLEESIADGATAHLMPRISSDLGLPITIYTPSPSYAQGVREFEAFADAIGMDYDEFFREMVNTAMHERRARMHLMIEEGADGGAVGPWADQGLHKWVEESGWNLTAMAKLSTGTLPFQVRREIHARALMYPEVPGEMLHGEHSDAWVSEDGEIRIDVAWAEDSIPGAGLYEVMFMGEYIAGLPTLAMAKDVARIVKGGGEDALPDGVTMGASRLGEGAALEPLLALMRMADTPEGIANAEEQARLWLEHSEPTPEFYAVARLMQRTKDALGPRLEEFNVNQPRHPKGTPLGGRWRSLLNPDWKMSPYLDEVLGSLERSGRFVLDFEPDEPGGGMSFKAGTLRLTPHGRAEAIEPDWWGELSPEDLATMRSGKPRVWHVNDDVATLEGGKVKLKDGWISAEEFLAGVSPEEGIIWRGISTEEAHSIRSTGFIQSAGTYNIGEGQRGRTSFGDEPGIAVSYASSYAPWHLVPTNEMPGYVIKVRRPPTAVPNEVVPNEIETVEPTPASEIIEVWEVRPSESRAGEMDLIVEWDGTVREGSRLSVTSYWAMRRLPEGLREFNVHQPRWPKGTPLGGQWRGREAAGWMTRFLNDRPGTKRKVYDPRPPHEMTLDEFATHSDTWWHGTLWSGIGRGPNGLVHVGTWDAAREALGARTGYTVSSWTPLDGARPTFVPEKARLGWRPAMIPVWIVGPMDTELRHDTMGDRGNRNEPSAEGIMHGILARGQNPSRGYYYENEAEGVKRDALAPGGLSYSHSAIVPDRSWLMTHKDFVGAALERGLEVDDEVLADYPDLVAEFREFRVDQPRWPKGHPLGGQWRGGGLIDIDARLKGLVEFTPDRGAIIPKVLTRDEKQRIAQAMAEDVAAALDELWPDVPNHWNGTVKVVETESMSHLAYKDPDCSINVGERSLFEGSDLILAENREAGIFSTIVHEMLHATGFESTEAKFNPQVLFRERGMEEGAVEGVTLLWANEIASKLPRPWVTPEEAQAHAGRKMVLMRDSAYMELVLFLARGLGGFGLDHQGGFRELLNQPTSKRMPWLARALADARKRGALTRDQFMTRVTDYPSREVQAEIAGDPTDDYLQMVAMWYGARFAESNFPIASALLEEGDEYSEQVAEIIEALGPGPR